MQRLVFRYAADELGRIRNLLISNISDKRQPDVRQFAFLKEKREAFPELLLPPEEAEVVYRGVGDMSERALKKLLGVGELPEKGVLEVDFETDSQVHKSWTLGPSQASEFATGKWFGRPGAEDNYSVVFIAKDQRGKFILNPAGVAEDPVIRDAYVPWWEEEIGNTPFRELEVLTCEPVRVTKVVFNRGSTQGTLTRLLNETVAAG
jgi:hypothetical protein